VLIGSLAEMLYLAFAGRVCWHFLQMVDAITWQGDVINGYHLGFKSPLQYLPLLLFYTKNKVM
jgi:hypothetical protein